MSPRLHSVIDEDAARSQSVQERAIEAANRVHEALGDLFAILEEMGDEPPTHGGGDDRRRDP